MKTMVNALAVSGAALFFTQTLHEGVHLRTALLVGVEVHAFNLFAVDTRLLFATAVIYLRISPLRQSLHR